MARRKATSRYTDRTAPQTTATTNKVTKRKAVSKKTVQNPKPKPKPSAFFTVPQEVRDEVYDLCTVDITAAHVLPKFKGCMSSSSPLHSVSRQIEREFSTRLSVVVTHVTADVIDFDFAALKIFVKGLMSTQKANVTGNRKTLTISLTITTNVFNTAKPEKNMRAIEWLSEETRRHAGIDIFYRVTYIEDVNLMESYFHLLGGSSSHGGCWGAIGQALQSYFRYGPNVGETMMRENEENGMLLAITDAKLRYLAEYEGPPPDEHMIEDLEVEDVQGMNTGLGSLGPPADEHMMKEMEMKMDAELYGLAEYEGPRTDEHMMEEMKIEEVQSVKTDSGGLHLRMGGLPIAPFSW